MPKVKHSVFENEEIKVFRLIDSEINFFDTTVCCGEPEICGEVPMETVKAYELLDAGKEEAYAVEIKGYSMVDAGLEPGDIAIINVSKVAERGDIVLAYVNNEPYVKYLNIDSEGRIWNDNKKWVYDNERQAYVMPVKENPYKDCEMTPFNERVSIMKLPNGKYILANNETHKPFYNTPNQMFDDVEKYNGELCLTREEDGKIYVYSIKAPLKGTIPPIGKKNVVDDITESKRYFYR